VTSSIFGLPLIHGILGTLACLEMYLLKIAFWLGWSVAISITDLTIKPYSCRTVWMYFIFSPIQHRNAGHMRRCLTLYEHQQNIEASGNHPDHSDAAPNGRRRTYINLEKAHATNRRTSFLLTTALPHDKGPDPPAPMPRKSSAA
jgi:hypothetical protein